MGKVTERKKTLLHIGTHWKGQASSPISKWSQTTRAFRKILRKYVDHLLLTIVMVCDNRILGKGSDNVVYDVPSLNSIFRTPIDPTANAMEHEHEQANILAIATLVQNDPARFRLGLPTRPQLTIKLYPRCAGDLTKMAQRETHFVQLRHVIIDVLKGLSLLHRIGYCHNDVKPENVLYIENPNRENPNREYQLGDFGHSEPIGVPNTMGYRGTAGYRPIEHEIEEGCDNGVFLSPTADYHAIAVFILVMAFGEYRSQWEEMYPLVNNWKANKLRVRSQLLNRPGWTPNIVNAVLKGLSDTPGERTTVEKYLELFGSAL